MKTIDDIAEDLAFIVREGEPWIVSDFSMDTRKFLLTSPNGNKITLPFDHVADPTEDYELFIMAPVQVEATVSPLAQPAFTH